MWNSTHFASFGGIFFRKSQTFMKAAFKDMGLSFVDSIVLIYVCENPYTIQEKIASSLALDTAAVARSLKNMESMKLIHREIDVNNQRKKKVYAEKKGEECKKSIDQAMKLWNEVIFKGMTEEEKMNIINSVRELQARVNDINIDEVLSSIN